MDMLKKVYRIFTKIERYAIFAVFFFATVMVVINVLGRKVFGFSFNWLEELNRYILIVCTFIGASIAVTEGIHPKMDSVVGLFKGNARRAINIFSTALFTVFAGIMTYYAFNQFSKMLLISAITATLKVPVYVFFVFIPIGFAGMTIRSLVALILLIAGEKLKDEPKQVEEGENK